MRTGSLIIISLLCAVGAVAQDNRITVPLSNPSEPATIKATLTNARITVVAGTGRDVIITANGAAQRERSRQTPPPGMKEIGGNGIGVDVEQDHNVVTIREDRGIGGDLTIETPVNTNLQLKTTNGHSIEVTGINGDQEVENTNGSITMTHVSGSVVAHTVNGGVTASLDRITGNKPMSFASLNGQVDVTLPSDAKARLHMKTNHGSIFSDFDVKLEPTAGGAAVENSDGAHAKYTISSEKTITGTINGGGPEYSFQTMNGNILIHKK
jgi:hypothetical protein